MFTYGETKGRHIMIKRVAKLITYKMNCKKKKHAVGTVPKSTKQSQREAKPILLTHKYITAHFHDLVQTLQ
jgi:hypothetical protein